MKAAFIIIFAVIGQLTAQIINCNFLETNGDYTCSLHGVTVADNQNANFIIGGSHMSGRNNNDVRRIRVASSSIPFIITQLFVIFPNVQSLVISSSGLLRVQSNAFANARNLNAITISDNVGLQEIQANAFNGAQSLSMLEIFRTGLNRIHESAFNEATNLRFLHLDNNYLRELPVNVFRPLARLDRLFLSVNKLQSLDGRLFEANNVLTYIDLEYNAIDRIGRNLLDGLTRLQTFNVMHNRCVNNFWRIGGATNIQTVLTGLSACFNNDNISNVVRRFVLELRGSLILRNENGTEVGRI